MSSRVRRPIVLVPGACLGGWVWSQVAADLRGDGYDVYPVTLTGLGERVHLAHAGIDLETHVTDVVNVLEYEALEDVVLVGHSYAGTVVAAVADRAGKRLNAVVYLDTSPLPDGMAIVDAMTPEQRAQQQCVVEESGDGWRWPVPDRESLLTGAFGSTGGLSDDDLRMIAERGTPQPYATMAAPVRLVHGNPPGTRRVAIFCTDGGIDVEHLRELIAKGDPRAASFADGGWELHDLPTGHWPMLSLPSSLAKLLREIADHSPDASAQ
jgi:pimeloyl-ACP methyl ester carboxylesterase